MSSIHCGAVFVEVLSVSAHSWPVAISRNHKKVTPRFSARLYCVTVYTSFEPSGESVCAPIRLIFHIISGVNLPSAFSCAVRALSIWRGFGAEPLSTAQPPIASIVANVIRKRIFFINIVLLFSLCYLMYIFVVVIGLIVCAVDLYILAIQR